MVFTYGDACSAINCSNNKKKTPHLSFFRVPKDPERSRKWVVNSRRADLLKKDSIYLYNIVKFCSLHFEANQFMNELNNRLVWNAVPTLFDIPNKPPQLSMKRKLPQRCDNSTKASKVSCNTGETSSLSCNTEASSLTLPTSVPHSKSDSATQTSFEDEIVQLNETIRALQKRVKCKDVQIIRLRAKLLRDKESAYHRQQRKICQKEQVKKDRQVLQTVGSRYLKKDALDLVLSQVTMPLKEKRAARWKDENKLFALSLLFYSTQAYRFLSDCFILPPVGTLQRYVEGIEIKCGISDNVFELLKLKVQQFSDTDRLVNMSLDEMSLMANLSYDSSSDSVVGFEDLGNNRSTKIANSVLVIMINGIFSSFKQPLLYYFSKGPVGAVHLISIFFDVVKRLSEIGLTVETCVTDQGSNFVDWRNRLGISQDNPSLTYEGQNIYIFYDTPHLLKSIRNNLYRYNVVHTSNEGCVGTASWKEISHLYSHDCNRKYKLAPKLTKKAVHLPAFSKMKVCTAARVLSHTVAASIETLVACGTMPLSATGTSDFCQKENDIFDVFNTYCIKGPVHLRNCITVDSEHLDVLHVMKPWIQSWQFVDSGGKDCSLRIKCVKGLLSNIYSLEMLANEVLNVTTAGLYLMSRKINQDCLEIFFSTIRQKGGFCSNPPPRQFSAAFNKCVLSKLINSSNVSSSNCEGIDWGQAILVIKSANTLGLQISPILRSNDSSSVQQLLPNVEVPLDIGEENSMTYVFGYILKKLFSVHKCVKCRTLLVDDSQELNSRNQLYCHFKSYDDNFGSLFICNEKIVSFLRNCEGEMAIVFNEHVHKKNCGALFVDLLMGIPNFPPGCCEGTKLLLIKIFVKVRLYFRLKFWNRDLFSSNKKPNNKLKKLSHLGC